MCFLTFDDDRQYCRSLTYFLVGFCIIRFEAGFTIVVSFGQLHIELVLFDHLTGTDRIAVIDDLAIIVPCDLYPDVVAVACGILDP